MTVATVGIVSSGPMGTGIAEVTAADGHREVVASRHQPGADAVAAVLRRSLDRPVEKGTRSEADRGRILARIERAPSREPSAVWGGDAVVATNASTLPVGETAMASTHPGAAGGLHLFTPGPEPGR